MAKNDLPSHCYWCSTGKYQAAYNAINDRLIPAQGEVTEPKKNRALEKMRKAANCYYDLFNNGLGNRASEFRQVFGFSAIQYRYRSGRFGHSWRSELYPLLEAAMDAIILAACHEQGIDPQVEADLAAARAVRDAEDKANAARAELELCQVNC